MEHWALRTHEKMKEVLMNPDAPGPDAHYYMIRGGSERRNITVWESGVVGGEYIKTYGHYHVGNLEENYEVLFGEGIALLQKMAVDENGNSLPDVIEEFRSIKVKTGDSVFMPSGCGHLLVNTGKTYLVTADDSPVHGPRDCASMPGHAEYDTVKNMRGFAYYVVEKNGAPALVQNPRYKEVRKKDFGGLSVGED